MAAQKKNFEQLSAEADKGDPNAQYLVALALEHGFGVVKDLDRSKEYFRILADKTAVWANTLLGTQVQVPFLETKRKPVVLLVEDGPATRTKIRLILEKNLGCLVVEVPDGRIAQSYLDSEILPDLMITDIHMPHVDGFKFAEFIARDKRFKNIPLVVVSADDDKESILLGKKLGIKHWLLKSSPASQIVTIVSALLKTSPK